MPDFYDALCNPTSVYRSSEVRSKTIPTVKPKTVPFFLGKEKIKKIFPNDTEATSIRKKSNKFSLSRQLSRFFNFLRKIMDPNYSQQFEKENRHTVINFFSKIKELCSSVEKQFKDITQKLYVIQQKEFVTLLEDKQNVENTLLAIDSYCIKFNIFLSEKGFPNICLTLIKQEKKISLYMIYQGTLDGNEKVLLFEYTPNFRDHIDSPVPENQPIETSQLF